MTLRMKIQLSVMIFDGTPRTVNELTSILDAEIEAAKRGEYITIEDFKNQSTLWTQTIK